MNKMATMADLPRRTRLIHESIASSPLGRVTMAGYIVGSKGAGNVRPRVFGSYALVYLLAGGGSYSDINGVSKNVSPGDAILVFPDLAHRYGPRPGGRWDEIYLVFDGPVFDQLRTAGILDPRHPVLHLGEPGIWLPRILEVVDPALTNLPAHQLHRAGRLISLLGAAALDSATDRTDPWLNRAMQLLRELVAADGPLDLANIACHMGLTYTAFRKRFTRKAGIARAGAALLIERAKTMLRNPDQTLARIARELGHADEFHLSRRFKQITGITPKEYRRLLSREA